jgi:carboxymethylenebutenolidase
MTSIQAGMINFPANGAETPGYLASPEGEGVYPGVVAIQEWWGLVPHIKDVVERLARAGFVALAPDLYHGKAAAEPDDARKLAMEMDKPRALREIQAAVDYLCKLPQVSPARAGVIGWCMGGGLAIQMAAQGVNVGATVVFYGSPRDESLARQVQAPLLGLFGEKDGGIPVELVHRFDQILTDTQVPHQIHIYPGTPHAFFNDSRPHIYQAEAAQDAWQRTLDWLRKYLV